MALYRSVKRNPSYVCSVTTVICVLLFCCGGVNGDASINRLSGVGFGPFMDLDPTQGAVVTEERITSLLGVVAPYCSGIRTYGARAGQENIPRLAKARGLFVAAGCWIGGAAQADTSDPDSEISSLISLVRTGNVDLAIVGNEVLLTNALTENQLIAAIQAVRRAVPGVSVTTAESWSLLRDHPRVVAECDVVLAHFYPWWDGVPASDAITQLSQNYQILKALVGSKEVIVGETGWPSAGPQRGGAVCSPQNASVYFLNFVSWARAHNVRYFYFEAFDESWKTAEGSQGPHWGIWDGSRVMKPGMLGAFAGGTAVSAWGPKGATVGTAANINITFSVDMARPTAQSAMTINGVRASTFGGTFSWAGRKMTFNPTNNLQPGTTYKIIVAKGAKSRAGNISMTRGFMWTFTTKPAAAAAVTVAVAPTASGAQLAVNLTSAASVSVSIRNLAGREVAVLTPGQLEAGMHSLLWNGESQSGTKVPAGVYLVAVMARGADGNIAKAVTALRR
jgi:exo-beta-1,3-glucanase (GH17 family)